MSYRILIPVKALWRDSFKVEVTSVGAFMRHLSQPFGVNWAPLPYSQIDGTIGHNGNDVALPVGERIYAAHNGVVIERDDADDTDGLGLALYDPEQKIVTWYWHNSLNYVKIGENVKAGQLIALSGGTGKSYGPHLHFSLLPTDDLGKILNPNNGYRGAVDPAPFYYLPLFDPQHMDTKFITDLYNFYFGRTPQPDELTFWTGKDYRDLLKAMLRDKLGLFT